LTKDPKTGTASDVHIIEGLFPLKFEADGLSTEMAASGDPRRRYQGGKIFSDV